MNAVGAAVNPDGTRNFSFMPIILNNINIIISIINENLKNAYKKS